jgi:hypothetical protein
MDVTNFQDFIKDSDDPKNEIHGWQLLVEEAED